MRHLTNFQSEVTDTNSEYILAFKSRYNGNRWEFGENFNSEGSVRFKTQLDTRISSSIVTTNSSASVHTDLNTCLNSRIVRQSSEILLLKLLTNNQVVIYKHLHDVEEINTYKESLNKQDK